MELLWKGELMMDQYYEEAVESEEETSDGSFSVVTDQPQHADVPSPEDEVADI